MLMTTEDPNKVSRTTYTHLSTHIDRFDTGLRYQDLFLEDQAVTKAVHMLSPEEQVARCVDLLLSLLLFGGLDITILFLCSNPCCVRVCGPLAYD